MQQLVLVVLCASELANDFAQRIVLRGAQTWQVVDDEVVDGEHIGKLDVQCRLLAGEEVVELINLELSLSVAYVDH